MTRDIALPWRWGPWTVDEFGYQSPFAVSYDGDHLFGIFPADENSLLPDPEDASVSEDELEAFCVDRLQGMGPGGSDPAVASTAEPVRFFMQPAMLSTCVSPPNGPVEHAFVELFFSSGSDPWRSVRLWASNHEWDTIDARAVAAFAPVFREFVLAHSSGPASADDPPPPQDAISDVRPGATCRDLHEAEFSYREAVAYWMREGVPDRMDADLNGIPCESVYPAFVVELVYGAPQWSTVEFVTTTRDEATTFEATGPAVDAGVVCSTGSVEPFDPTAWGWADTDTLTWTRAGEYVCSDGSGTFVIGHRDNLVDGQHAFATWTIGTTGTGDYEWLAGGGRDHLVDEGNGRIRDRLLGRIAVHEAG